MSKNVPPVHKGHGNSPFSFGLGTPDVGADSAPPIMSSNGRLLPSAVPCRMLYMSSTHSAVSFWKLLTALMLGTLLSPNAVMMLVCPRPLLRGAMMKAENKACLTVCQSIRPQTGQTLGVQNEQPGTRQTCRHDRQVLVWLHGRTLACFKSSPTWNWQQSYVHFSFHLKPIAMSWPFCVETRILCQIPRQKLVTACSPLKLKGILNYGLSASKLGAPRSDRGHEATQEDRRWEPKHREKQRVHRKRPQTTPKTSKYGSWQPTNGWSINHNISKLKHPKTTTTKWKCIAINRSSSSKQ